MKKTSKPSSPPSKLRLAIGLILSISGLFLLTFAALLGFTDWTLTFAAILLIFAGVLIGGSDYIGRLIADLLN